jgi:hypothetical protein
MQSLPSELKCLIVESSSGSPNSLAALARTHTAFQREAEKALYETLYINALNSDTSRNDSTGMKCMETLATNSEKAGLVRFLTIEYRCNTQERRTVTTYLLKSLISMHSLSDFRVKSWPGGVETQSIMELGKILWSVCKNLNHLITNGFCWRYSDGHFRLQTLYCHDFFNISQIIKSQTGLQILGIYCLSGGTRPIVKTLKAFQNAQISFPIVVALTHDMILNFPDYITLFFPAFYSVDRCATIPQVLAQSFCKDQSSFAAVAKANNIRGLSIFLIDSSDLPFIYALAKDMAVSFPRIGRVRMFFERQCDIVSFLLTIDDYNRT